MKISSLALNVTLAVLLVGSVTVDHLIVASAEDAVQSACETHVSYDKSGSMYCVDGTQKRVTVARQKNVNLAQR